MRVINIVFTKSKKKLPLFSWLIRLIWGTEYSHTAMIFYSSKYDKYLVYHASAAGLNFMSKEVFDKEHEIVFQKPLEVPEEVHDNIVSNCIDRSGYSYGLLQGIGVGLVYLLNKVGITISNPFSDGRSSWICSEWIAYVMSIIYEGYDPDLETVSPKEIYDLVNRLP